METISRDEWINSFKETANVKVKVFNENKGFYRNTLGYCFPVPSKKCLMITDNGKVQYVFSCSYYFIGIHGEVFKDEKKLLHVLFHELHEMSLDAALAENLLDVGRIFPVYEIAEFSLSVPDGRYGHHRKISHLLISIVDEFLKL